MTKEELYAKAAELAGRPIEVEQLKDGRFIAMWMRFESPPPLPSMTEDGALLNLINMLSALPVQEDNEGLQVTKEPDII